MFDRAANLEGAQIISYRVDPTAKWCVLVGIAPGAPERPQLVKGHMQLYSVEQARSQALEAHAAAFSTITPAGRAAPAPVIAFAQKALGAGGAVTSKLHVIELGPPGQAGALKKSAELFFPPEFADDFPVSMQIRWEGSKAAAERPGRPPLRAPPPPRTAPAGAERPPSRPLTRPPPPTPSPTPCSDKYGLVYVITKLGLLFVYDLETASAVYRTRISGGCGGLWVGGVSRGMA